MIQKGQDAMVLPKKESEEEHRVTKAEKIKTGLKQTDSIEKLKAEMNVAKSDISSTYGEKSEAESQELQESRVSRDSKESIEDSLNRKTTAIVKVPKETVHEVVPLKVSQNRFIAKHESVEGFKQLALKFGMNLGLGLNLPEDKPKESAALSLEKSVPSFYY